MEKSEMIKMFKNETGSLFITRKELSKVMGYADPHNVDKFLYGLESVGKRYFIPDVVIQIKGAAIC